MPFMVYCQPYLIRLQQQMTMSARLFTFCFILWFLGASAADVSAETYFEILDNEENSFFGTITDIDNTQVLIDVQGELQTIPLERVVKIRNLAPNPYEGGSPASNNQHQQPARMTLAARSANEHKLAEFLNKIQTSDLQAVQKTFPGTVIAIELKDGSRLTSTSFAIRGNRCEYRLVEHERYVNMPLEYLSSVRFMVRSLSEVLHPPEDWQRLAVPNAEGDRLVVGNPGAFDVYTGILGEVSHENASFNIEGEVLPIPRRRIFGLVFHGSTGGDTAPATRAAPFATLTLWAGTQGMISDIGLKKTEQGQAELTWTTSLGWSDTVPLNMVNEIDFGEKGIASLFDFERVLHEISLPFPPEFGASGIGAEQMQLLRTFFENRAKTSREIVLDGIAYERGITLQGKASLEYRLPKPFASITAVIGIEDQFRPHASSTLQILADSPEQGTRLLGTWELRGDIPAQQIHLNLPPHCRAITIIAEPLPQSGVPTVLTIAEPKLFE